MTYDSVRGGVGETGGACDPASLPVPSIGEVTGAPGGGGVPAPSTNRVADSEFGQLPAARVDAATPTTGSAAGVGSWQGGTWRAVTGRTPTGHRAVEVTTTAASSQGVILYPSTATPVTGTPLADRDQVAGSVHVKAPKGQNMILALRVVSPARGWVGEFTEVFVGTGGWQRVSIQYTAGPLDAGNFAALAVGTKVPTAAGVKFSVCGPQVEAGWVTTPYQPTS